MLKKKSSKLDIFSSLTCISPLKSTNRNEPTKINQPDRTNWNESAESEKPERITQRYINRTIVVLYTRG